MNKLFNFLFKEDYSPYQSLIAEHGSLQTIRNHIINSIYLISGILGTFAIYGATIRALKFGWKPFFLFSYFLYIAVWAIYLLRHKISLYWKALIFCTIFFVLATFLNYTNGIISGSLNYVFITTLATLIFGWRVGVLTIILTLIIQSLIGWGYLAGTLHYSMDMMAYINSKEASITAITGGIVIASILVFTINRFYKWLIILLNTVSVKMDELASSNHELLLAKQKAEENDRLKSSFLANMSHEIRTPMNAILGFSALLSRKDFSEESKARYVRLIQDRSQDLMRIIEDILDISKIEANQMSIYTADFEIYPLIQETFLYYELKKNKKDSTNALKFSYSYPNELKPMIVHLDKHRLKQILNNLLDNAFKFTKEGEIQFGCQLQSDSDLLFWIKDSGIGISKDKQSIIFDRFRQVDDKLTTREYGGAGLGLSIVQGLVKLMNGKIWVESEPGVGSTFYVSFPSNNK